MKNGLTKISCKIIIKFATFNKEIEMKLERIILRNVLIGISSLSLYSCGDGELRSAENKNGNIADVITTDNVGLRDYYDTKSAYEINITDQVTDKNNLTLDSHLGEESYNLRDTLKFDNSSDFSPEGFDINSPDSNFYTDEVDSLQETVIEALACIDKDSDGYGLNCILGSDCDDYNPSIHQALICGYDGNSCGQFQLCVSDCPSPPVLDECNGVDDNCDGFIDEDFVSYAKACFGYGGEDCSKAYTVCVNGEVQISLDNKLFNSCMYITMPCPNNYSTEPQCNELTYQCNLLYYANPCPPLPYESECDGLDNNCDGIVDGNTMDEPNPLLIQYIACGEEGNGLKEQVCTSSKWGDLTSCIFDCIDWDNDNYGPGPNCLGEDCDDDNPFVHEDC